MNDLFTLLLIGLNIVTAVVFFRLGKGQDLPTLPFNIRKRRPETSSNFTDPDLEDIREVDPEAIKKSFMESIKKRPKTAETTEEAFEDAIN